jgi:hypothetical protein
VTGGPAFGGGPTFGGGPGMDVVIADGGVEIEPTLVA